MSKETLSQGYHFIRRILQRYNELDLGNKAGSLSYYTIISIFPLLLLIVSVSSYLLPTKILLAEFSQFLDQFFPQHSQLLDKNLVALFTQRKTFSWFGAITLYLSATTLYGQFERWVDQILKAPKRRSYWMTRIYALLWFIGILIMILIPFLLQSLFSWIQTFTFMPHWESSFLSHISFPLFSSFFFIMTLFIVSSEKKPFKLICYGSIIFTVLLELGKILFNLHVLRGLSMHNLIYGSLSSLILSVLWIYYFYSIFLLSIVLMAVIEKKRSSTFIQKTLNQNLIP